MCTLYAKKTSTILKLETKFYSQTLTEVALAYYYNKTLNVIHATKSVVPSPEAAAEAETKV